MFGTWGITALWEGLTIKTRTPFAVSSLFCLAYFWLFLLMKISPSRRSVCNFVSHFSFLIFFYRKAGIFITWVTMFHLFILMRFFEWIGGQVMWTFSLYLEAVAILPQLVLLQRTRNIDNLTGQYVFFLGYATIPCIVGQIFFLIVHSDQIIWIWNPIGKRALFNDISLALNNLFCNSCFGCFSCRPWLCTKVSWQWRLGLCLVLL